jgi:phosphoglycolate phosphatase
MRALLFDLDGTLTDPREGITRSIAHALERMGLEAPPLESLTFAIGPSLRGSFARLLACDDRARIEQAVAHYRERFAGVGLYENALYPGIVDALHALAPARCFVATSKPQVYAERIVRHFGLDPHFVAIHGCELDGTREDKRDLLAHLMATHGVAPGEAVMIGDRGVDMRAGRHHGMRALGVRWGYGSDDELREAGAHALCDSPAGLPAALETQVSGLGFESGGQ